MWGWGERKESFPSGNFIFHFFGGHTDSAYYRVQEQVGEASNSVVHGENVFTLMLIMVKGLSGVQFGR